MAGATMVITCVKDKGGRSLAQQDPPRYGFSLSFPLGKIGKEKVWCEGRESREQATRCVLWNGTMGTVRWMDSHRQVNMRLHNY